MLESLQSSVRFLHAGKKQLNKLAKTSPLTSRYLSTTIHRRNNFTACGFLGTDIISESRYRTTVKQRNILASRIDGVDRRNIFELRRSFSTTAKPSYRELVQKYGVIIVVFHSGIWVVTLGFFNILVFNGVDVSSLVEYIPFIEDFELDNESDVASASAKFLIAYTITSITGPIRLGLDVVAAPWLARRFPNIPGMAKKGNS